jgi:hypothetical protein
VFLDPQAQLEALDQLFTLQREFLFLRELLGTHQLQTQQVWLLLLEMKLGLVLLFLERLQHCRV